MNGTEIEATRSCAVCQAEMTFRTTAVALRTSPKRYCSPRCRDHAAYLRRKARAAQKPVIVANPRPCDVSGWPLDERKAD